MESQTARWARYSSGTPVGEQPSIVLLTHANNRLRCNNVLYIISLSSVSYSNAPTNMHPSLQRGQGLTRASLSHYKLPCPVLLIVVCPTEHAAALVS